VTALDDVPAARVVLAADPRGFLRLRRVERMRPSPPCSVLLLAARAEPQNAAHDNLVYESWSEAAPVWATVPTLLDPSLAPPGEHLVVARTFGEPADLARH
jgi:phytoene dehydrogenase-like protein